jgi:sulfatase modifying factor 1
MPDLPTFTYDVFISYSHADEDWVCNTLLRRLEKAGLRVCIDYRDFVPGKPALINMQDAVNDSRFTLLIITPNWVKSEWALYESLLVRTKDPAGLQRRTIPLRLEVCDLPDFISNITWVDFTRPDRLEIAWTQLLTALGAPPIHKAPPTVSKKAPRLAPTILTISTPICTELVRIPAGDFLMGSDPAMDDKANDDEKPQHRVYLPDFYIGKVPVTNAQFETFLKASGHQTTAEIEGSGWGWTGSKWDRVKGANWRHPAGPKTGIAQKADHPVVQVSWDDAVAFCRWLSEATGQEFRLPTEAEWEKAARGTKGRLYPWGNEPPDKTRCNFELRDTVPVGKYPPGATPDFGVLDLAGNVWEWCSDWYDADYYTNSPEDSPPGPEEGQVRALRGGSWYFLLRFVRAAVRGWYSPDLRDAYLGFRCACS